MPLPLAYHLTWTTYGTWLHGDARRWVEGGLPGIQEPDVLRQRAAQEQLNESPVRLDSRQRELVRETIEAHCRIRGWKLHAVNARSNHVHAVVTADGVSPDIVMNQFKAWCSRRLNERFGKRQRWWTAHGSTKWVNDEAYFCDVCAYVSEKQGVDGSECRGDA